MRWATSSGCSMKLVVESITPGQCISGSFTSSKTFHSCSCRGLAPSKETAAACSTGSMISRGNVVVVRALVVAPAEMQAHALGRDVFGRRVEHFEMQVDDLAKLRERQ